MSKSTKPKKEIYLVICQEEFERSTLHEFPTKADALIYAEDQALERHRDNNTIIVAKGLYKVTTEPKAVIKEVGELP